MTLIFLDNIAKSWFKVGHTAGGVARCSTYLFPLRSPGSHPPFRGFGLYSVPPASGPIDSSIQCSQISWPGHGRVLHCNREICRIPGEH